MEYTTPAQVEYFAMIGRMIALKNRNRKIYKNTLKSPYKGHVFCVVINESYDMYSSLYEAARAHWRINEKQLPKIDYVFAVYHKTVVAIFKCEKYPLKIENINNNPFEDGKYRFYLSPAEIEIQLAFLGKEINGALINYVTFYL